MIFFNSLFLVLVVRLGNKT